MQSWSILVFALLAAPAASASLFAENAARLWLSQHGNPGHDQLAELRTANPEAYAIVKTLLSKRSLGLLDPKHPTASFSKVAPVASVEQGPEVFENLLSPEERHHHNVMSAVSKAATVAMPYAEVAPAAQRDWLNWKPQSSDDVVVQAAPAELPTDDAMVQHAVGAFVDQKDKKATGLLSQSQSVQEIPQWVSAAPVIDTPAATQEIPDTSPVKKSRGYADFSVMAEGASQTPPSSYPATKAMAYLTGLDLTGDSDAQSAHKKFAPRKSLRALSTSSNVLQSFDWDDDDEKPAMKDRSNSNFIAPKVNSKKSLMGWLVEENNEPEAQKGRKSTHTPTHVDATTPAKSVNRYMLDLSK
jgi:hypothetical protein